MSFMLFIGLLYRLEWDMESCTSSLCGSSSALLSCSVPRMPDFPLFFRCVFPAFLSRPPLGNVEIFLDEENLDGDDSRVIFIECQRAGKKLAASCDLI
jgi:hypothetical protein